MADNIMDIRHLIVLVPLAVSIVIAFIAWALESADTKFLRYQIYICYLALALTAALWPFMNHPFIFSLVFIACYHEGWHARAYRSIKSKISDYMWLYR